MTGMIQNRDSFLTNIANSLGRERKTGPMNRPQWEYQPQEKVLTGATQDELVDVFKEHCQNIHTTVITTTTGELPEAITEAVTTYGGESIVAWKDERFSQWGLDSLFKNEWPKQGIDFHEWNYKNGRENVNFAENANIGITISEITLAESATVVLFSDKDKGRTVSFLPKTSIVLVPKSSIVPRMTQAARKIRELHTAGKEISACINFISGPSNSADIELQLVVGVHGPFKATCILIDDL